MTHVGPSEGGKPPVEISVVIPLYNKAQEIARALDSVKHQTIDPAEVIVVDDGSTDASADIVSKYRLPGLSLVQQKNAGECAARNRGVYEAKGDLIAFLDADDEWEPGFLRAVAEMWHKYPDCGMYGTAYRICVKHGDYIVPTFSSVPPKGEDAVLDSYFASASEGPCIWSSAVAVPRTVLRSIGGFPVGVRRGGDRVTWLRIAVDYPVAFRHSVLATWHQGASNRVKHFYKQDSREHPVIRAGLEALRRDELTPQMRRDLVAYVARTQLFVAKQLIRFDKRREARELLTECVAPTKFWWRWLGCLAASFLPVWLFGPLYRLKCNVANRRRTALAGDSE
ncbi:MAG: glycosyltransferase family A protein [Chloroflexota bacterium]